MCSWLPGWFCFPALTEKSREKNVCIFMHTHHTNIHMHSYIYNIHVHLNSNGTVVKNPPASTGDARDVGSIPGSGRSLGWGNGNQLQYSCLGNPMVRGAWQATVLGSHRVRHNWVTEHESIRINMLTYIFLKSWICTSTSPSNCNITVENSERDGNTRPPDLPLEKPVSRSGSNS